MLRNARVVRQQGRNAADIPRPGIGNGTMSKKNVGDEDRLPPHVYVLPLESSTKWPPLVSNLFREMMLLAGTQTPRGAAKRRPQRIEIQCKSHEAGQAWFKHTTPINMQIPCSNALVRTHRHVAGCTHTVSIDVDEVRCLIASATRARVQPRRARNEATQTEASLSACVQRPHITTNAP